MVRRVKFGILALLIALTSVVGLSGANPAEAANLRWQGCPSGYTWRHFTNHWDACVANQFNSNGNRVWVIWEWGSYQNISRDMFCGTVTLEKNQNWNHGNVNYQTCMRK